MDKKIKKNKWAIFFKGEIFTKSYKSPYKAFKEMLKRFSNSSIVKVELLEMLISFSSLHHGSVKEYKPTSVELEFIGFIDGVYMITESKSIIYDGSRFTLKINELEYDVNLYSFDELVSLTRMFES